MPNSNPIYRIRINKVIDYINDNLNKTLPLSELADVAHFSPYYFHRIFVAVIGESVNSYTSRVRIEKAARLLRFSDTAISNIAYQCGYSSPATFSRSFKEHFNNTPSAYRKSGTIKNSKICKELHPLDEYLCDMSLEEKKSMFPITIKKLPQRKVAYIRVTDSYKEGVVIEAFEQLIDWAKAQNLYSEGQFFGMSIDDPMVTPQDKYRYEACMLLPADSDFSGHESIQTASLAQCSYATTSVSGDISLVATAMSYMYNDWLINSSYEPEHQHGLEYFKDRENICNWNSFDLELFIPVKPLNEY